MRNRKKHKTIDDYSVSQLLDDFLSPDMPGTSRSAKDVDDEEYIRMMLKKDVVKQLERTKRESQIASRTQSKTLDDNVRQRFFPDVDKRPVERESPPVEEENLPEKKVLPSDEKEVSPENGIVAEILDSIVVKHVSGLAAQMREAVDFVQGEIGASDAEHKLVEALERYQKPLETTEKKMGPFMSNDDVLVLKRCQNCYFCVGERNRNGSTWCLCTNPYRTPDVEIDDSWVNSGTNLSCWKSPQD